MAKPKKPVESFDGWRRSGGASLLLVPLDYEGDEWVKLLASLNDLCFPLGINVHRGSDVCERIVSPGLEAMSGIAAADVLVFKCPLDFVVWEAWPILSPHTAWEMRQAAAFFEIVTKAVATRSSRFAWVYAHDWPTGIRLAYRSGNVADFLRFASSVGAWREEYITTNPNEIQADSETPFWYQVVPE